MSLIVPNSAEADILGYILKKDAPEDLDIKLYSNNYTPLETSVVGDYTEVLGGGYAEILLDSTTWTITPGDPAVGEHPQVTWSFTGSAGLVYGYYVVRRTSGDLAWAERFTNGPYDIQTASDQIRITPRFTANNAP